VVQMFRLAWVPFSLQHARQQGSPALFSRVLTALMVLCAPVFLGISLLLPVIAQVPSIHQYVKAAYWLGRAGHLAWVCLQRRVRSRHCWAVHRASNARPGMDRWCGRCAQPQHLHCSRASVGYGERRMGNTRCLRADGGSRDMAIQSGLSRTLRMAPSRTPCHASCRAFRGRSMDSRTRCAAALGARCRVQAGLAGVSPGSAVRYRILSPRRTARFAVDVSADPNNLNLHSGNVIAQVPLSEIGMVVTEIS
jgi:hypothetical protein